MPRPAEQSACYQTLGPHKPFNSPVRYVANRAAYSHEVIVACLLVLMLKAEQHGGIDYLQVFEDDESKSDSLWFIEDGPGGAITALLPSDY